MVVSRLLQVLLMMHPHAHEIILTNLETPELVQTPSSPSKYPNFVGIPHSIDT
jgi:hypothetical protein